MNEPTQSSSSLEVTPDTDRIAFKRITFTSSQVIAIVFTICGAFAGVFWFFYTQGSFSPDLELGQQASTSRYAYEKASADFRDVVAQNRALEKELSKASGELDRRDSGIALKRLEVEERIAKMQAELDSKARIAEASAREKESDALLKIAELEQAYRTTQSENARLSTLVAACVDATSSGEIARTHSTYNQPGAAITAIDNPQDGTTVLQNCIAKYHELVATKR